MPGEIERLTLTDADLRAGDGVLHQFSVPETYKIHTHNFYELFLVPKGKAIHQVNGDNQFLTEGSFVLMRPDDIHKYAFFNDYDFEIINLGITKSMFEDIWTYMQLDAADITSSGLPPHVILSGYILSDAKWKLLQTNKIKDKDMRYSYIRSILPGLAYLFHDSHLAFAQKGHIPKWFADLLEEMNKPENFIEGLPRLIRSASMSQEYLNRAFRKYIDMTPTEYINIKRVNHAVSLLVLEDQPIIDISSACGFNNLSHFYRVFGKQFGCSPKKFLMDYKAP